MIRRLSAAWRRARREIGNLELWRVLQGRGTRGLASHNPQSLVFAVERCSACRHVLECSQVLESASDRAIEGFCPNTMYLRHLDAMRRHALKRSLL